MSQNKFGAFRQRILDECFQSQGKYWPLRELMAAIERRLPELGVKSETISRRTLMYDLNSMRAEPPVGYGAPIKNKKNYGYYYSELFTISGKVSDGHKDALKDAVQVLRQFPGLPFVSDIQALITAVGFGVGETDEKPVVQYETALSAELKIPEKMEQLYRHIREGNELEITYQPFDKKSEKHIVAPYLLKEFNNRWFLIVMTHLNQVRNMPLDRILEISPTGNPIRKGMADFHSFFSNVIGVSIPDGAQPEDVVLRFSRKRGFYVKTKPLHASQQIIADTKSNLDVQIRVIPNLELEALIMYFGADVQVIKPESLAEKIKKNHQEAVGKYK
ncbi:MAG: WYL domain-containing protein [Bacteroidetes bacterium]|nr:WYL domain-containing protein [Bacteroidota bacterium]